MAEPETAGGSIAPGDIDTARRLIEEIRIGVLTTLDAEGCFHARPLQTLEVEGLEALWFFTGWDSPKVHELYHDRRVSLAYADVSRHRFVAVSGRATLSRDAAKARQLWRIEQRAYYPDGPDDERLALLRVAIERAEYWVAPGALTYLVTAAKAAITGTPAAIIGENARVK